MPLLTLAKPRNLDTCTPVDCCNHGSCKHMLTLGWCSSVDCLYNCLLIEAEFRLISVSGNL